MTSQHVHRPWYLCEDVLSKIMNSQLARADSVPRPVTQHVDRVHLPPEVLQVQLEPPPRQLAGHHPVEEHNGSLLRHPSHSTQHQRWPATRMPAMGGALGACGPPRPLRPEARSVSRQGRELSSNRVRERVPECTGRRPRSHSVGHSAVWSSMARLPDDRRRDGRHLGVRMTIVCCCGFIRRRRDAEPCGHL